MMQARALRVLELCDDHTTPSCLVSNSLAKPRYRSVNTLVLHDPWLTQESPVTFPVCALYQLFVRSCVFAHHGLYCSHVCTHTHHSLLQHLSLVFTFVIFSSQMGKHQNVRSPLGTTEWNHLQFTPTVTSWWELTVFCTDVGLHTRVTRCSAFKFCVLPTGHAQCYPSTGSD